MSPTNTLPPGFTSVDDAVKLIESDTRQNPVVDMDWLIQHAVWLDKNGTAHTFRIPKVRRLAPSEVYRTRRGVQVEYEHTGDVNVFINTSYEKEWLKKTIYEKYRELAGAEYKEASVKAFSTVADDAQGRDAVRPRTNTPIAKEGASIGSGETVSTNGDGLSV